MELAHYGRFFKRHALLILLVGLLTGAIAGGVAAAQPERSQATESVLLKVSDPRNLAEYDYDQFYVVQAIDQYAANVVSWLNSAQVKDDVERNANAPEGRITGKKNGGTIELSATAPDDTQAKAMVDAATTLIDQRTQQIAPGPNRSSFDAIATPVAVQKTKPQPVRDGVIGLVAGLILGVVVALVVEAARPARKR